MVHAESIYNDARTNLRVKDRRRVAWYLNGGEVKGQAKIRNISASGMLIETNSNFKPDQSHTFSFDSALGQENYIPQHGRLIWYKRKNLARNKFECGIKFLEPTEFVLTKLRQRIQRGILRLTALRRLRKVVDGLLLVAIIGLIVTIVWQGSMIYQNINKSNANMLVTSSQQAVLTQSYSHRLDATQLQLQSVTEELNATKRLYQESEIMLGGVNEDLVATKAILAETERLLAQSEAKLAELSQGNLNLKGELATLKDLNSEQISATRAELNNTIALLQEKNLQLNNELNVLQDQIKFYEGDVKNKEEGVVLLNLYKDRIKQVKGKIKYYRKEAEGVRTAALKEQNRIRLALGNNGFMVKNGEVVTVDYEKYEKANAKDVEPVEAKDPVTPRNVNIDVDFFE